MVTQLLWGVSWAFPLLFAIVNATAGPAGAIYTGQTLAPANDIVINTTAVLKRNCAYVAWYPDDGNPYYGSEGAFETLQQLDDSVGTPAFAVGAYAHIEALDYDPQDPATWFNGSELEPYLEQASAANATFVASIAPVHGFEGFLPNDTNQAQAIVRSLQPFVDAGVQVWLRWGHEMDWYFTRGSDDQSTSGRGSYYVGTAAQYVTAWKTTYQVVKTALPSVLMMWCPNVNSNDNVRPYWPGPEYVDLVGMDYYIQQDAGSSEYQDLVSVVKSFHDEFALQNNLTFWLGETGTRTNSTALNLKWIQTCTSEYACNQMPMYRGIFWFHYIKNYINHYIALPEDSDVAAQFRELMQTSG